MKSDQPQKRCNCCGQNLEFKYSAAPLDYCLDKRFDIFECQHCGHGMTGNVDKTDLELVYEGGAYDPKEKFWHKLLRRIFNILEESKLKYLQESNSRENLLLEIGTGKGDFLSAALSAGYDAYGIEPSSRSYQMAKLKLQDRVHQCTLEDIHLRQELNKKYDYIFLWHVLEHLDNPENSIRILKSFLKPTGVLVFGVPNFDSYQSKFGKSNWYHLDPPRHLSHFTPSSVDFFLKKNEMNVQKVFYNSFYQNMIGDIMTLVNCVLPHKNILFNLLRFNSFYLARTHAGGRILNFLGFAILAPILFIPSLLLTFFSQLTKKAGTIVVVARIDSKEIL